MEPTPAPEDLPDAPAPDNPNPSATADDSWFYQDSTEIQPGNSGEVPDWAKNVEAH